MAKIISKAFIILCITSMSITTFGATQVATVKPISQVKKVETKTFTKDDYLKDTKQINTANDKAIELFTEHINLLKVLAQSDKSVIKKLKGNDTLIKMRDVFKEEKDKYFADELYITTDCKAVAKSYRVAFNAIVKFYDDLYNGESLENIQKDIDDFNLAYTALNDKITAYGEKINSLLVK